MDVDLIMYLLVELAEFGFVLVSFKSVQTGNSNTVELSGKLTKMAAWFLKIWSKKMEKGHACLCLRLITKSQDISGRVC